MLLLDHLLQSAWDNFANVISALTVVFGRRGGGVGIIIRVVIAEIISGIESGIAERMIDVKSVVVK